MFFVVYILLASHIYYLRTSVVSFLFSRSLYASSILTALFRKVIEGLFGLCLVFDRRVPRRIRHSSPDWRWRLNQFTSALDYLRTPNV